MTKVERRKEAIEPISSFTTVEEAEFWDSHSVVDEIDEGTQAGFHYARKSAANTISRGISTSQKCNLSCEQVDKKLS